MCSGSHYCKTLQYNELGGGIWAWQVPTRRVGMKLDIGLMRGLFIMGPIADPGTLEEGAHWPTSRRSKCC